MEVNNEPRSNFGEQQDDNTFKPKSDIDEQQDAIII